MSDLKVGDWVYSEEGQVPFKIQDENHLEKLTGLESVKFIKWVPKEDCICWFMSGTKHRNEYAMLGRYSHFDGNRHWIKFSSEYMNKTIEPFRMGYFEVEPFVGAIPTFFKP